MKNKAVILFLFFMLTANVIFSQEKPVITVMDFSTEDISKKDMEAMISRLSSALFQTGVYTVIDISQRETLLLELEFSLSGCVDDSCALEAGKLLSAENIVVGNISLVGKSYSVSAKTLITETGETLFTADGIYADIETLLNNIDTIALQLSGLSENAQVIGGLITLGAGIICSGITAYLFLAGPADNNDNLCICRILLSLE